MSFFFDPLQVFLKSTNESLTTRKHKRLHKHGHNWVPEGSLASLAARPPDLRVSPVWKWNCLAFKAAGVSTENWFKMGRPTLTKIIKNGGARNAPPFLIIFVRVGRPILNQFSIDTPAGLKARQFHFQTGLTLIGEGEGGKYHKNRPVSGVLGRKSAPGPP